MLAGGAVRVSTCGWSWDWAEGRPSYHTASTEATDNALDGSEVGVRFQSGPDLGGALTLSYESVTGCGLLTLSEGALLS